MAGRPRDEVARHIYAAVGTAPGRAEEVLEQEKENYQPHIISRHYDRGRDSLHDLLLNDAATDNLSATDADAQAVIDLCDAHGVKHSFSNATSLKDAGVQTMSRLLITVLQKTDETIFF